MDELAKKHAAERSTLQQEHRNDIRRMQDKIDAITADSKLTARKFQNSQVLARGLHAELRRVHSVATSMVSQNLSQLVSFLSLFGTHD